MCEEARNDAEGRTAEVMVELEAAPEIVWRALTDPQELSRWFPFQSEVTPGQGGRIVYVWDDAYRWPCRIETWEPERKLRLTYEELDGIPEPAPLAVDFTLEAKGGSTTLRLVHSGFGRGSNWDEYYDGVRRGWTYELRSLRHYLRHHLGSDRHVGWARKQSDLPARTVYERLMSPQGLLREGSLQGLAEGDPFRIVTVTGDLFEGRVLVHRPPTDFSATADNLNHAILRYEIYSGMVNVWLASWNGSPDAVEAFRERWQKVLTDLV